MKKLSCPTKYRRLLPCARGWKVFLNKDWAVPDKVIMFSSVQFSFPVVSNFLWPHGLQHARPPCPSPTPRVYSNSCPSSRWCHPTISSSVVLFSCFQSFPASGSFPWSQFYTSGGKSIGASVSVVLINIQDWSSLGSWLDLLADQGTLKGLLQHHSSKVSILRCSAFFIYICKL